MKILISLLENNIFCGVLIKKGFNNLTDAQYQKASESMAFLDAVKRKLIYEYKAKTPDETKVIADVKPDFDTMSYADLKKYVAANGIKTDSMKKNDLLKALKGE